MTEPAKQSGGWRGKRGSRQERGYGRAWEKKRDRILERDDHLCQPCLRRGKYEPAKAVDHKVARAEGGTEDDENLQSICDRCHREKSSAEGARAQGRRVRPRIGVDGWPEEW